MLPRSRSSESSDHPVRMPSPIRGWGQPIPPNWPNLCELDGERAGLAVRSTAGPRYDDPEFALRRSPQRARPVLARSTRRNAMIDTPAPSTPAANGAASAAAVQPDPQEPRQWPDALEGRISEEQVNNFRREVEGRGLPSYPHPWLMPDYWQFATVSMGLGPLQAVYQARYMRYLHDRGLSDTTGRKVWAFLGDGEIDEPE